jgi:hypothetical protein
MAHLHPAARKRTALDGDLLIQRVTWHSGAQYGAV